MLLPSYHIQIHRGATTVDIDLNPNSARPITASIGKKVIWRGLPAQWEPWRMAPIDVDHDGREDFVIGLYKVTRHFPQRIHVLYVYGFNGEKVYPKWRGSSMGTDFVDFLVLNAKSGQEIVTLDRLLDGTFAISGQRWNGFGFDRAWQRGHWKEATIRQVQNSVRVTTEKGTETFDSEGEVIKS